MEDIIVGLSTSLSPGAVSIIRLSGKGCIELVNKIFKGKNLCDVQSHTINYGYINYKNEIIDEVLVSVMKSPRSYTMEDVVEINSHGGVAVTKKIFEICLEIGARCAEEGEFTKRAFLNGRIDLAKAEAVNDLISAKSSQSRKLAINNVCGNLTNEINKIRNSLLDIISNIDVNIDYPEYNDINEITSTEIKPNIEISLNKINELIENSKNIDIIKNGVNVALIGKPNVGKSSILNFLLQEEKAIVTNIAGTTRDIVEGNFVLDGILINLIDTAGIRNTDDVVEQIGVEKSIKINKESDLSIIVLNNNERLTSEEIDIINNVDESKRIIFVNKDDLEAKNDYNFDVVYGNTVSFNGLDKLKNEIKNKLSLDNIVIDDKISASNIRQKDLLKKAKQSILNAIKNINNNSEIDIIEIDLKECVNYLGEIIGANYSEDLLDKLFSNFCLGK